MSSTFANDHVRQSTRDSGLERLQQATDLVPVEDPLRIKFNQMHEYSVWVLMVAMAAALIAFFIIAYRRTAAPPKDNVIDFDFQNEFKM